MTSAAEEAETPTLRALILAGSALDGQVLDRVLGDVGIESAVCRDAAQLCSELERGAGVAVVAAECLCRGALSSLKETLARSPDWSEMPVIVMSRRGRNVQRSSSILRELEHVARVTFLERPVGRLTLMSAVRAALSSRRHQYRIRDTIDNLQATERALKESEARFRLAVDNAPVVVFELNRDLRYVWVTHPDPSLTEKEVVGRTDVEILGEEQGVPLIETKRRVLETGRGERLEHWLRFDRGWTAWDLSLEPIRNEAGEVTGLTGVTLEITDRKLAEEKVERAEARLRAAVEGSGIGVFEYDPLGDRMDATERSWQIVAGGDGAPSTRLGDWRKLVHPEDRERVQKSWAAAFEPGGDGRYEVDYRVVRLDGTTRWVAARGQARFQGEGEHRRATSLVGTVQDITEERATEERLRELTEELEQLATARTRKLEQRTSQLRRLANQLVFAEQRERSRLAKLLHDHLQQILAAAKIQIDLLQAGSGPELGQELGSVQKLLEDAVQASRSLSVELSPPALQSGPLSSALQWQSQWMESHHKLETELEIDEDLPRISFEAKILLFDATRELLFNAVKHADVNRCTVRLYASESPEKLCLEVEDAGKGFDPRNLSDSGSAGFGLFSIRERLEAMGGRMEIESAPDHGSSFRLYVPASEAAQAAEVAPAREPLPREGGEGDQTPAKIRLLVVDDHPIVRDGLVSMIRRSADMEVVGEASDGEEAIELTELMKPDVVVMDINMPRVDGLEATRIIKQRQPDVRIVGLSIQGDEAAAREMTRAGASAFLPKGGRSEVFFETLRKVIAS